jgi:hypothetical protein
VCNFKSCKRFRVFENAAVVGSGSLSHSGNLGRVTFDASSVVIVGTL